MSFFFKYFLAIAFAVKLRKAEKKSDCGNKSLGKTSTKKIKKNIFTTECGYEKNNT